MIKLRIHFHWYIFPSKCVWKACFPIMLAHGDIPASGPIPSIIWSHWTYKMPVRYILSSVWVRLSIFSLLSIIQYVGLYVFSLSIYLVMIERIYILCLIIIIKSEVWTVHCLVLGHETMVSTVCLSIYSNSNLNVAVVEVWEWICTFIMQFIVDVTLQPSKCVHHTNHDCKSL